MAVREQMNLDYAKAKIVIGSFEFASDKYGIYSIEIRTGAYDGNAVGIGCAYTSTCTITMQNIDEIKKGIRLEVYFLIKGSWERLGRFWINKSPARNKANMTIEAHGALGEFGNNPFYVPGMFCIENRNTIGRLMRFVASTTGIGTVNFYANKPVEPFLEREVIVPVKGDKATFIDTELGVLPNYPAKENGVFIFPGEKEYADKYGISVKDFLSGIAILFGGNVTERNGKVWISPIVRQGSHIFSTSMCPSNFSFPSETYELDYAKLNFIHTNSLDFFARIKQEFFHFPVYCGTDKQELVWLGWEGNQTGEVAYEQNVECDWIGYSAGEMYDNETYAFVDGDFSYKTGSFSLAGYNKELYAGNVILLEDEAKNLTPFYIGEVTLKWDGGFITEISCNCNANESGSFDSSAQSGISSSANMTSAMITQNVTSFATINFSNIKDSTISGSKFIDGTITGSKIENSTITGNLIANNTLTGNLIKDGTITNNLIRDSTLTGSKFQNGTLTGSLFENGTITNTQIKDSTLTGAKIADATIGFEKVDESFITKLTADSAYIKDLTARVANIGNLTADDAIIKNIQTVAINADYIRALTADIGYLKADEADLRYTNITLGNIDTANIDKANVGLLFNEVGLIDRATIVDGHITGFLDAVEVNANQITAGTLIAERLLLKGSEDGLLFALNNMGELVSQNVDTLDGGILTERTVTADKIVAKSITTSELDVTNIFGNKAVIKEIFAQDIEASGSITGATLYGTEAYIDNGVIGPFIISDYGLDYDGDSHHFQIDKNSLTISKTITSNEAVILNRDGFRYNKSRYALYTDADTLNPLARQGELDLVFTRDEYDNSVKTTWMNVRGIHTSAPTNSGATETQSFAMDVKTLDVSGQIKAKNGLTSSNDHGFASIASDTEGGRLQVKGSGNWYEIDAAGGTLRFIDGSAGKEIALMNSNAFYSKGEIVVSNNKSIRFGTPTSDYMIKGTETTITIGDKDNGGNSGYVYLQGDTKVLTGSLEAPKIKEGGALLTEKYCYYQEGTGSVPGGSGWMGVTVTFPKPYLKKPFVMVVQNAETSTENIWIQAASEKAVSFKVYAPNSAWTYSYRWMAMGIKA